ncbi:MAG TPA: hypothetical protein VMG60_12485 [Burkholderiaceae bacterium]|nr:hypothetical protein [Burkholderiaceae bacterium]
MTVAPEARLALCVARGKTAQQAAIDAWLRERSDAGSGARLAVVAEGAFFELVVPPQFALERLAAGCVCCVGLLPLRVTLTRLLRTFRPDRVLLLLADASHVERLQALVASGQLGVTLEQES